MNIFNVLPIMLIATGGFFDTNFQKQYYQAINTDVTECQHCHRNFEGMEYIGDKCPYCGKEIETKVGESN